MKPQIGDLFYEQDDAGVYVLMSTSFGWLAVDLVSRRGQNQMKKRLSLYSTYNSTLYSVLYRNLYMVLYRKGWQR